MRRTLDKLTRASGIAALGMALLALGASAGSSPTITGFNLFVVHPGADNLEIDGSGFSQFNTSDCFAGQTPKVNFIHLPDNLAVAPQTPQTDSAHCSDTRIIIPVPAGLTDAYAVGVTAYDTLGQAHASNRNLQILVQPAVTGIAPAAGEVGTSTVTVSGSNLKPPIVKANSWSLSCGVLGAWNNTSVTFDPQDQSCSPTLTYKFIRDANNANNTQTVTLPGGSFTFLPPKIDGGSLGSAVVGQQVTITGANLGSVPGQVTFQGNLTVAPDTWADSGLKVTVPAGAQSGALTVSMSNYSPGVQYVNGPLSLTLNPLATAYTPAQGIPGQDVTVSGYNFGSSTGTVAIGGQTQAVKSWADRSVAFTVGNDTDTGTVTVLRHDDGATLTVGTFTVVPKLTAIEDQTGAPATSFHPGDALTLVGLGFGSQQGNLLIDGRQVAPQLWSRTTAFAALPMDISAGSHKISITNSAGVASNQLAMTVIPLPSPSPGAPTPKPGTTPKPRVSPFFDLNHQFHKPPKAASPVDLTLDAEPKSVTAGDTSILTVTLKLNGKPVAGSTIKLSMIYAPCDDYAFSPDSGVTDATGTFKASVKVCAQPGNNIILAQSGIFSDQDQVIGTGTGPSAVSASSGPKLPITVANAAALGPLVPLIALGCIGGLLVAVGLFINLRSSRTAG